MLFHRVKVQSMREAESRDLRRTISIVKIMPVWVIRRKELGKSRDDVQHLQKKKSCNGRPVSYKSGNN